MEVEKKFCKGHEAREVVDVGAYKAEILGLFVEEKVGGYFFLG